MKPVSRFLLGSLLFLFGCDALNDSDPTEARIELRQGIDGVRYGDSSDEVRARLGEPGGGGIACGGSGSWHSYLYAQGPHAGLEIYFFEEPLNTAGPADLFTVRAPYDGTTEKGIGIGSTAREVQAAYGEPKTV